VKNSAKGKCYESFGDIDAPISETGRIVSTGPCFAYLRIAEGCNNCCAYCVIPSLRGRYRSREINDIVEEAKAWQRRNKRLIVIAQDITRYGRTYTESARW
jgi:ribosomal protein S12 methylthiotransferase